MFKIRNNYILKKIFQNAPKKPYLGIIKYNKKMQYKLGITLDDYKNYNQIIVEITPNKYLDITKENIFINIKKENKSFFHIFFNDNKEEIDKNYINSDDKIEKIKVVIDIEIQSLQGLFKNSACIKEINFTRFRRKNILDMSEMFYDCGFLDNLNLTNFNTDNVTNMESMFYWCKSLKEINFKNFNTINVTNMNNMLCGCASLKN